MSFASIEKVADAVLFEGYILYPYRASAIKNQQRWNFGTLYPRSYVEAQAPQESWHFHAECLIEAKPASKLNARVRFLQLLSQGTGQAEDWSEGFVRSRNAEGLRIERLLEGFEETFDFSDVKAAESRNAPSIIATIASSGRLQIKAEFISEALYRVSTTFANVSVLEDGPQCGRLRAQAASFVSAHLLLQIESGTFVSLLEPKAEFEEAAMKCVQHGVFPVLVGEKGSSDQVLFSPIILYDYPQVAPESQGDYFDGCEMDEMLALRVLTLTDEEKAEIRRGDRHARQILERTEMLPEDHLLKLHGAVRDLRPADSVNSELAESDAIQPWDPFEERPVLESVSVFGVEIRSGDRVRLWPQRKADIIDMAMEGKTAIVEAIEQDLEDNVQLAVVLEDDPGRDMGMLRQPGHRFFFHLEEIEPLTQEAL